LKSTSSVKKTEIKIDDSHVYTIGRHGPVIKRTSEEEKATPTFFSLKKGLEIDLVKLEKGEYTLEELIDDDKPKAKILGIWEGKNVIVKKGKFGLYADTGEKNIPLKALGNRPIENIQWEDILPILSSSSDTGILREITPQISIRKGGHGDYIFFKTSKMKKPLFYKLDNYEGDYLRDNVFLVKRWMQDIYNIQ
jgi:topoisomerase IA-like protein